MISAVNGDLWLDNIYCFRYRVKLNNPLMGTETGQRSIHRLMQCHNLVKLNNPLMGTETVYKSKYNRTHRYPYVKLNNPLMGTETFSYMI